ncbi:MAG: hypothetical protein CM15mP47_2200 [Methanobacteriota archaeon]|nr:MAG: hypothetical protein CM15mP47_2200 [Euryarchaeota archaeon]
MKMPFFGFFNDDEFEENEVEEKPRPKGAR